MLEIRPIEWDDMNPQEQKTFAELARPHSLHVPALPTIALGAYWDNTPCGIAIATYLPLARKGEIEHVFVAESFRRRRIATDLLEKMEQALKDLHCVVILLTYPGDTPDRTLLEHVLRLYGWRQPHLLLRRYFYNIYEFHVPWLDKPRILPPDITLHGWNELTDYERHRLEVQVAQGAYPYAVYPYGKGNNPDPLNSLFLRRGDKVIGWLATHRTAPDTILYAGVYVHLDYRGKGYSLLLISEGIKRQKASPIPMACFELNENQVSDAWQRFVADSLAPQAIQETEVYSTWKELRQD